MLCFGYFSAILCVSRALGEAQVLCVLFATWTLGTWLSGYTLLFLGEWRPRAVRADGPAGGSAARRCSASEGSE